MTPETEQPRGSAEDAEPRFLIIGRITKPHGVRGEVRVEIHTELPERFHWLERVFIGDDTPRPYEVAGVRFHKQMALLQLVGVNDRNGAEALRNAWVQIPEEEGIPLDEGQVYLYEVLGLRVITVSGRDLGEVVEVIETKANDVYVVRGPQGEVLIPEIADVIVEIDLDNERILIDPLPGLLPDE
jgi:16S rRNA processing protein RimM